MVTLVVPASEKVNESMRPPNNFEAPCPAAMTVTSLSPPLHFSDFTTPPLSSSISARAAPSPKNRASCSEANSPFSMGVGTSESTVEVEPLIVCFRPAAFITARSNEAESMAERPRWEYSSEKSTGSLSPSRNSETSPRPEALSRAARTLPGCEALPRLTVTARMACAAASATGVLNVDSLAASSARMCALMGLADIEAPSV